MKPENVSHFAGALAGAMGIAGAHRVGSCFGGALVAAQVAALKDVEQERIQVMQWAYGLGIDFDALDADQQDQMVVLYRRYHA